MYLWVYINLHLSLSNIRSPVPRLQQLQHLWNTVSKHKCLWCVNGMIPGRAPRQPQAVG